MNCETSPLAVHRHGPRMLPAIVAFVLGVSAATSAAPAPVYENTGVADTPMIDAVTFLNRGTLEITAPELPYETQNTLYYTNFSGAFIEGTGGMRFDFIGADGFRYPASDFHNSGIIRMAPGFAGGFFGVSVGANSWVLVDATNIVNRGGLAVGPQGLLRIDGHKVQLARSGLRAGEDPDEPISTGFVFDPFYTNDDGVQDLNAGVGVNNALDPGTPGPFSLQVLGGSPASSGSHEVLLPSGFTNRVVRLAPNGFALTNTVSPTNWVVQAIFVDTNSIDPQFKVDVRWGAPRIQNVDGAMMAMVQFTFEDVDTITGEPFTNYVYVLDNLGAMTNAVFFTNLFNPTLQRPSSYEVTRVTPPEWDAGVSTNVVFTPDLLVGSAYASTDVTNIYAAYSASIGPAARTSLNGNTGTGSQIPAFSHPTNQPGRIEIEAGTLDLNLSRFRSEGLLSIKADQLEPRPPFKLDSTVVRMDVASTNGPLQVSNIVQSTVRRFSGSVSCWSGVWTNQAFQTGPDPADPTLTVTNTIEIRFHALIVGHNFQTIVPVRTLSFAGRAQEAFIFDDLTVQEGFRIDAPMVDIRSTVNLQTNAIVPSTFPSLLNLTNSGSLSSFVGVQIGSDARPIPSVVNSGDISGTTLALKTVTLENSGTLFSSAGDIAIETRDLKFEGGQAAAAANLRITANDFKAQGSGIQTGTAGFGSLILDVATRLTDGDTNAANSWFITDGIQLVRKPAEGDLAGTEVISFLNRFREGIHIWSGEDRGATPEGFTNNASLGRLVLDGTPFTLFTFQGPDSRNPYALYVDFLDLTNSAVDVAASLNIATNFTIYFADASVPPDELDGALEGRLRWVQTQAGLFSGVNVPLSSGGYARINRALLASTRVDSDGDGIPNSSDPQPFESSALRVAVRLLPGAPAQTEVSWTGAPSRTYRVEYSSSLDGPWNLLTTRANTAAATAPLSVSDDAVSASEPRFYRVVEIR